MPLEDDHRTLPKIGDLGLIAEQLRFIKHLALDRRLLVGQWVVQVVVDLAALFDPEDQVDPFVELAADEG
jgi:hypothetical protein